MSRVHGLVLLIGFSVFHAGAQNEGNVSVLVYADYLYSVQRDTSLTNAALNGEEGFNAFQFRRVYLTYDHRMSEEFATRVRLEADEAARTSDGRTAVFVKDAYLKWKGVFGRHDLMIGVQPTPAFEVSEEVWGFRSLEKTIMDLRGFVGSRDLGISLRGPVDPAGSVHYVVFAANGSGNRPEGDKWKRVYARLGARPVEGLDVTVTGDFSARPDIVSPYSGLNVKNSVLTGAAFLGVRVGENVHLGIEGVIQSRMNGYDTGIRLTERNMLGISVFGRWSATERITLVGRYDFFDPNTHTNTKDDTHGYFLGGISWSPGAKVEIIPNVQVETYEATGQRSYKPSVTGRLTVVWAAP